ncbi:MAG TPA: alkaline phosphatase family protein [Mycobacteriales bacterium]|nr:alkaline phosphatase family protein [Mycobacteriales bacterium]
MRARLVPPVLAVALLASCGSDGPQRAEPRASAPPSSSTALGAGAVTPGTTVPLPTKLLVVVLENHSQAQAWEQMPYLRELGTAYGRTSSYRALTHPSLPNYLALAGGSTFGVHDDRYPASHPLRGPSVFGQALDHGRTAKTYAEGMTFTCRATSAGRYAVKHNPWAYFADAAERTACRRYDVPLGTTSAGALRDDTLRGTLPNVGMVIPDGCSDAHDCSLATADRWLRTWGALWTSSPDFRTGRLAVVVTFDEDDRSEGNAVLTVVAHRRLHRVVVATSQTHLELSAWLSRAAGAPPLRSAVGHRTLGRAFTLSTS